MSSRRASIACGFLVFTLAAVGVGCGDDDDAGPPQIQPHQNPVGFGNFGVDAPAQEFQVILTNVGGGTLDITGVGVNGDANCAMTPPPEFSDPLPIHLVEGQQTFLAIYYDPGGPGDTVGMKDQISVPVTSNSNEFPVMEISVCGCVVEEPPTPEDPGPPCECNLLEVGSANCGG